MSDTDDKDILESVLHDSLAQSVIKELGIENSAPEVQAALIARLGANVMDRVTVAILQKLPEDKQAAFAALIGSGNMMAVQELVKPYINDLQELIRSEVQKEVRETVEAVNKKMGT